MFLYETMRSVYLYLIPVTALDKQFKSFVFLFALCDVM